jgi:hypothetical protein
VVERRNTQKIVVERRNTQKSVVERRNAKKSVVERRNAKKSVVERRNAQMELPDDVLDLVREFSRPRMQFIREYQKVLYDLGITDWPELKKRLCDKDAPKVIAALLAWAEEFLYTDNLYRRLDDSPENQVLKREVRIHVAKRDALDRAFRILLVGEVAVRKYERWLRYEDMD